MAAICAHCPNQIAAANIFPHYALYNGRKYEQSTAYCLSTSNALPLQIDFILFIPDIFFKNEPRMFLMALKVSHGYDRALFLGGFL